ncbi:MAG: gliding motility-associated C-terminal domain-containing protein [Fimbriimonadaceae bacterium]|nr:gliding motility-associated C-terminal domain-containing protein [Chitinophagales bacterium]
MKKNIFLTILSLVTLFYAGNIKAQITAYPDTTICSGETITLYADLVEICTDCYTYKEIPYALEPIGGTSFSMIDDTHSGPYEIGFTFCFFGIEYTEFYLSSNGWISFDEPTFEMDINWTPDGEIPDSSPDVPSPAIFSPWTDWNTGACTDCLFYEVIGTAPNRRCVITWENVPLFDPDPFGSCAEDEGTFQIVLIETSNFIENHFEHVSICPDWDLGLATQGVQNVDGDFAYTVSGRNATDWSADNESWRWFTSEVKWYEGATLIDSGATTDVSPDITTTYTVVQTLCDGTTYSDDVTITVANSLSATVATTDVSCGGADDGTASITVTGTGGPFSYEWSSGESDVTSVSGLEGGEYFVTVTADDGCVKVYSFIINEIPELILSTDDLVNTTCFGYPDGEVSIVATGGTAPYSYSLNGDAPQVSNDYNGLVAGDYTVTVTDAIGCVTELEFTITEPALITIDAGPDVTISSGASYSINAVVSVPGEELSGVSWGPPGGFLDCGGIDPCFTYVVAPENTTTYLVSVSDLNGCAASDFITIFVEFIPEIFFPNAFSPNADGFNDFFQPWGYNVKNYNLVIYNRWGEMVYETNNVGILNNKEMGWDGIFNGEEAEIGSYTFYADVMMVRPDDDAEIAFTTGGSFVLVR